MEKDLLYEIAITMLDGVGAINARKLVAYCSGVKAVFEKSHSELASIPGIGPIMASKILGSDVLNRAGRELDYIVNEGINTLFFLDEAYPVRLNNCPDAPALLYYKGDLDLNNSKLISIVGTRNATHYGKEFVANLLAELKPYNPIIVSGLAYGIDICAHKEAIKQDLRTIGVVAHGLDLIYPAAHRDIANLMKVKGAVMSEYTSGTPADRERFPMRNRIVAGMSDAVIVVESAIKGGSMITADLANGYSRDVFAVPGRINDNYSKGCNQLIQDHRAHLLSQPSDLIDLLGWEAKEPDQVQRKMFVELNNTEELIVNVLQNHGGITIDEICHSSSMPMSKVSSTLLNLEFNGLVLSRPGKKYLLA